MSAVMWRRAVSLASRSFTIELNTRAVSRTHEGPNSGS
jgi:hypothetical protein